MNATQKLALALHHNPRSFALLIGSGVSRSSHICTGWDIALHFCAVEEQFSNDKRSPGESLDDWYRRTTRREPDYAHFLEQHFDTHAERQQFLEAQLTKVTTPHGLIESAQPAAAHHAIAALVEYGLIKIIITTNFDRLLEDALSARGIAINVITSAAAIARQQSYKHADVTLIKVHGDYKEIATRNTVQELEEYEPPMEALLIDILKDYGCIACGWSSLYDKALRKLVADRVNTRFPHFYCHLPDRSDMKPEETSTQIGNTLNAKPLQISDADSFFTELLETVTALRRMDERALTGQVLVNRIKYHIDRQAYAQAYDLVMGQFAAAQHGLDELNQRALRVVGGEQLALNTYLSETTNVLSDFLRSMVVFIRWAPEEHIAKTLHVIPKVFDQKQNVLQMYNRGFQPYFGPYLLTHVIMAALFAEGKTEFIPSVINLVRGVFSDPRQPESLHQVRAMLDFHEGLGSNRIPPSVTHPLLLAVTNDLLAANHTTFDIAVNHYRTLYTLTLYMKAHLKVFFNFPHFANTTDRYKSTQKHTIADLEFPTVLGVPQSEFEQLLDELIEYHRDNAHFNADPSTAYRFADAM
jgi:hypothetical protein